MARRPGARADDQAGPVHHPGRCRRGGADLPDHQSAERVLMISKIELGDITVDVVLKDIKNVHLSVYPPVGRVRISAPKRMSLDTIRVFAISKLDWIKQQQAKVREQERETPRDYVDRESHYVWGKRYLPTVPESDAPPAIELKHRRMLLRVRPGTGEARKRAVVEEWYRER